MARPKKATVDYFPHVTEQGATLFILQQRWGNDGYAAWFKILERIGTSDGHFIDCRTVGTWRHLQAYTMVSEQILTEILDTLAELEAIDRVLWSYKVIYSQNFVDGVKDAYRRRTDRIPTRGMVFAVTNVQDKEFLTAETLPKDVYAVRSTERERDSEREREKEREQEKKQRRLSPQQVKDEYLNYAQVLQVGGQMPVLIDIANTFPADIIIEAFQAGSAGNKRGPGFLGWCLSRMRGKMEETPKQDATDAMLERLCADIDKEAV